VGFFGLSDLGADAAFVEEDGGQAVGGAAGDELDAACVVVLGEGAGEIAAGGLVAGEAPLGLVDGAEPQSRAAVEGVWPQAPTRAVQSGLWRIADSGANQS
jgi:hypothetical protein